MREKRENKVRGYLYTLYGLTAALLAGYAAFTRDRTRLWLAVAALLTLYVPLLAARLFRVRLSPALEIAAVVFLFCTMILGEIYRFYEKIPVWDNLLHLSSGFFFCAFGFALYADTPLTRSDFPARGFHAATFSFSCAAVWELFEFTLDATFGTDMQKATWVHGVLDAGLYDTMTDMACGVVGALLYLMYAAFHVFFGFGGALAFVPTPRSDRAAPHLSAPR